jgi:ubiquitin-protein ligase
MNKRIPKDIAMACDESLNKEGIFYIADENNMTHGYALIIGPEDTPYAGGLFFFEFLLPQDYPFAPPKVAFCTYDGVTRFHPNLYREGKVCLSILGTWSGEKWASTMNITTVLFSLQSLLHDNPITCEPSYEKVLKTDIRSINYNKFVQYQVVRYVLNAYKGIGTGKFGTLFKDAMEMIRPIVFERIGHVIDNNKGVVTTIPSVIYSLGGEINWVPLETTFQELSSCVQQPS